MSFEINHGVTAQVVAEKIANYINTATSQTQRVLWLISGGSNTEVTVLAAKMVNRHDLVSIAQVDERYGELGHDNSNWTQLLKAGFYFENQQLHPILQGKPIEQTVTDYELTLKTLFKESDVVVGQFGIGEDGHTAGILPGSTAALEDSAFVCSYEGPDYQRITITPKAITNIDQAFTYVGKGKEDAIERLKSSHSIVGQPAQILKYVQSSSVYTN